jgi:glycosyltransferase involved in cell wall biosynthesis
LYFQKELGVERMWHQKKISVVFPAYNEEPGIEKGVRGFRELLDSAGRPLIDEILVIDNNSKDRTAEIAKAAGARVITETKQGYGNALMRGLREADGDLIVLCEPDGTFVPKDIFKLLSYSEDFTVVCGTRTTRELIWAQANMGWFLRIGNLVVAKFLQVLYGTCSLSDCGCTFRLLTRAARDSVMPHLFVGQSHFLPNLLIASRMTAQSIIEIPINYRGRLGDSKITGKLSGTLKTGTRMILLMLSSWPKFLLRRRPI